MTEHEQRVRAAHAGAALCRAALRQTTDQGADVPLDPDDPIRDRALRRARAERKAEI